MFTAAKTMPNEVNTAELRRSVPINRGLIVATSIANDHSFRLRPHQPG